VYSLEEDKDKDKEKYKDKEFLSSAPIGEPILLFLKSPKLFVIDTFVQLQDSKHLRQQIWSLQVH